MLSQLSLSLLALAGIVVASKPGLLFGRDTYSGVATFNNYAAQGNTVCGPKSGIYHPSRLHFFHQYLRSVLRPVKVLPFKQFPLKRSPLLIFFLPILLASLSSPTNLLRSRYPWNLWRRC